MIKLFNILHRPRLGTFEKIVSEKNEIKNQPENKLYKDASLLKKLYMNDKEEHVEVKYNKNPKNCNDTDDEIIDFEFDFTEDDEIPSPRTRFFSA